MLSFFFLVPEKLECEKLMISETAFNLPNSNRKKAANLKPVISLQSDWDYKGRGTKGDQLDTARCKSESVYV